jgi:hypothetical protein
MRVLTKQQNIATELSFLLERDGVGPAPDRAFLFRRRSAELGNEEFRKDPS